MEVTAGMIALLEWVAARERSYAEVIEAWRSNCPRLAVWDDAVTAGLVRTRGGGVELTELGRAALARLPGPARPRAGSA